MIADARILSPSFAPCQALAAFSSRRVSRHGLRPLDVGGFAPAGARELGRRRFCPCCERPNSVVGRFCPCWERPNSVVGMFCPCCERPNSVVGRFLPLLGARPSWRRAGRISRPAGFSDSNDVTSAARETCREPIAPSGRARAGCPRSQEKQRLRRRTCLSSGAALTAAPKERV